MHKLKNAIYTEDSGYLEFLKKQKKYTVRYSKCMGNKISFETSQYSSSLKLVEFKLSMVYLSMCDINAHSASLSLVWLLFSLFLAMGMYGNEHKTKEIKK